jgi:hypothetical protein
MTYVKYSIVGKIAAQFGDKYIVIFVFRGQISGWVGPLDLDTHLYIAQLYTRTP